VTEEGIKKLTRLYSLVLIGSRMFIDYQFIPNTEYEEDFLAEMKLHSYYNYKGR